MHEEGSSITPAKKVSQTNPRSRWTAAPGGPAYYAYSTNYLVDTEASIIVDVEATPAHRTQEVWSTQTRIEPVKEHFPEAAKKLIGDTAYGTAEFLSWMVVEQGIEPHGPVWDKGDSKHDRFGRTDFRYDEQADSCTCPGGIPKDGFIRYRASLSDCSISSMKALCSPNTRIRKVRFPRILVSLNLLTHAQESEKKWPHNASFRTNFRAAMAIP